MLSNRFDCLHRTWLRTRSQPDTVASVPQRRSPQGPPRPRPETARPTLASVASRAGVSPSTASLAFAGSPRVAPATRDRVLTAAAELGYAGPDPIAASLRRGRSGVIGTFIWNVPGGITTGLAIR